MEQTLIQKLMTRIDLYQYPVKEDKDLIYHLNYENVKYPIAKVVHVSQTYHEGEDGKLTVKSHTYRRPEKKAPSKRDLHRNN